MAAFIATAVVNSTACNNRYICSFFYIKIIINHIGHSCGVYNDRNMYFFSICLTININVDARLILLFLNFDMLAVTVAEGNSIVLKLNAPDCLNPLASICSSTFFVISSNVIILLSSLLICMSDSYKNLLSFLIVVEGSHQLLQWTRSYRLR